MSTGIIVARMQSPYLHAGYKELIRKVGEKVKKVIIVLGESAIPLTNKNPLSYEIRKKMITEEYPFMLFEKIQDCSCDKEWSKRLDKIAQRYENPILFGSRDSFIHNGYSGVFITQMIECESSVSSTDIRTAAGRTYESNINKDVRIGIIYAIENRFPIVYPTVDVALVFGEELLLAKKKGEDKYCLIRGFADKADISFAHAAFRELTEEVKNVELLTPLEYVGSYKIEDYRYKGTKDCILTTLFTGVVKSKENLEPGDDLKDGELKWFDIDSFDINLLQESHHVLFINLKKHLYA